MEDKIIKILKEKGNTSLTSIEINDKLGLTTVEEYQNLESILNKLCKEGIIYYSEKKKRYTLFENTNFIKGKIIINPKGYGFVVVDNSKEDIYIASNNLEGAYNNDIVIVEYLNRHSNEGRVVKVIYRDESNLIGEIFYKDNLPYVKFDKEEYGILPVDNESASSCVEGHKVLVKRVTENNQAIAYILKIIGHKNDVGVDILSYVYEYGFSPDYNEDVLKEVEELPNEVKETDMEGRVDLRDEMIFTIDGIDTKDIDDAISIKQLNDNDYELGVHIADVSHYVRKDSYIDKDAFERGTSVYLVDRVVPMLPHKLSNGICSLNPNVDRLALSCVMTINSKGYVTDYKIFKSVIRSKKQMNYDAVNSIFIDDIVPKGYEEFVPYLKTMQKLSFILRNKMVGKGYLEFNSPEPVIKVDEKCHPISIEVHKQREGEKLIENFMIVANETVAGFVEDMNLPGIYRVHDKPNKDKLIEYLKFLALKGYNIKADINKFSPKDYQKILNKIKNDPAKDILSTLAIQTMAKAKYSEINIGHYGIASKRYSHFTSPIRRYPDLTLHRLVKDYLDKPGDKKISYWKKKLPGIAIQTSKKEQDSIDCERDVEKMKKCEYMEDHIGEIYEGYISGLMNFGFFVMLDNTVEGLVRLDSLENDNYNYIKEKQMIVGKNRGTKYTFGDIVKVKVIAASKETCQVDFELSQE